MLSSPVIYERDDDGAISWPRPVDGDFVRYRAKNIRLYAGKPYASVELAQGGRILDEDDFALSDREKRNRLANACHKMLNGLAESYPPDQMQHDILLFCRELWREHVGANTAVRTRGLLIPTEPDYIVYPYVLKGAGTILFAPPGMGKSWTGLLTAVSVDAGVSHVWEIVAQGPVLYINLERSEESFARRLGQVNETLGLPRDRDLLMIHKRGASLADVYDGAQATIQREGVILTVIDSLSRAGMGSLVKDDTANKAMDLANALGSAWYFLAHTPRADAGHTFGSQMFDAAADLCIQMLTAEMDAPDGTPLLGIGMKVTKANDIPKQHLKLWTYEFDRRFGLANVRPAHAGEWSDIEDEDRRSSPQDRIEQLLLRKGELPVSEIAEKLSMDLANVGRYLKDMESKHRVTPRKEGRTTLYRIPYRGDEGRL